jgi:hypothetical protein
LGSPMGGSQYEPLLEHQQLLSCGDLHF